MAFQSTGDKAASLKTALEAGTSKPDVKPVNRAHIPAELAALTQWVGWKFEQREGKWTKIPVSPQTGRSASSTDPTTWGTLEDAIKRYQREHLAGVGFVFSPSDPYCGIDLDDCHDPGTGEMAPWASAILDQIPSYAEVSPSRTGVKIFIRARKKLGWKCKKRYESGEVEIYDSGRFFAVTGEQLARSPSTITEQQQALQWLYGLVWPENRKPAPSPQPSVHPASDGTLSDEDVVRIASNARNGDVFKRLWTGDTSAFAGDESRADLALCNFLAFYVRTPEAIDRLFRQSGLMREKWERRADYRQATIAKALEGKTEFWSPKEFRSQRVGPDGRHADSSKLHTNGQAAKPRPPSPNEKGTGKDGVPDPHETDVGNAERVVTRHGQDLLYSHPLKRWFVFDGQRFAADATGQVAHRVKETQRFLYGRTLELLRNFGEVGDDPLRKKEFARLHQELKHLLRWENDARITACINQMKSELGIPVLPDQLDADHLLFNIQNGTIDLRTGKLRPHARSDRLTKLAPVKFDAAATCPLWLKVLDRVLDGNTELIGYLQRVTGYCMSGSTKEQMMWLFHGSGANGKSTVLGALLALFGDYGMQAVSELLMARRHEAHPTERADLFGRRLVCTIEIEEGQRMAEALMKQLTGGDRIRARKICKDSFEFSPTFKIIMAANHLPAVRGTDLAVWRRLKLIPFTVTIPDEEKDPDLPTKLLAELPGILNWAIEGCLTWQKHGLGEPDEVRLATTNYRAEQDIVQEFLNEQCFLHAEAKTQTSKLFEAYQQWSGDRIMTQKAFTRRLEDKGHKSLPGTGNRKFYHGVGLPVSEERSYP